MTNEKLPTHYRKENYLKNFWKGDNPKMPEIEEMCRLMDKEDEKGAKNVKAVCYFQDFDLFNIVGVVRGSEDFNFMNDFQFGNLMKSYVDNFGE